MIALLLALVLLVALAFLLPPIRDALGMLPAFVVYLAAFVVVGTLLVCVIKEGQQ